MCDTIVATPRAAADRAMLFGKNSDRQLNEAQAVEVHGSSRHDAGAAVQCTYIAIPQVAETHGTLLCRPFWMWGAEMGANDQGVVIGNEGLHARIPAPEVPALTGMDLVRLGLERGGSAAEALEVIIGLLERFGQGGDGGHRTPAFYNNGFLIADHREAFVLETIGRDWMAERVESTRSLSNIYSVNSASARASGGMAALVRQFRGDDRPGGYADAVTNPGREHIAQAGARRSRSSTLLREQAGALDTRALMAILRDHGGDERHPELRDTITLCMHAGARQHVAQTTGSLVSELRATGAVHWVTATASPCLSIYKPLVLGTEAPDLGPAPTDLHDPNTRWWRHEQLHRQAVLGDLPAFLDAIGAERDAIERSFAVQIRTAIEEGDPGRLAGVVRDCWAEATALEESWHQRLPTPTADAEARRQAWAEPNRDAGLVLEATA